MTAGPIDYPPTRPPLGLPMGSVRALLALIIGALFWALLLFSERAEEMPLSLYFLLALQLLFFTAHGKSIPTAGDDHPSPWWLPRGFFRAVIFLGFVLTVGWKLYSDPRGLLSQLTPTEAQLARFPYFLIAVGAGFTLGRLLRMGPWQNSYWFQDIQAWVAVLAMTALGVEIVVVAFINPSLGETLRIDLKVFEYVLTGIVACYYGIRS